MLLKEGENSLFADTTLKSDRNMIKSGKSKKKQYKKYEIVKLLRLRKPIGYVLSVTKTTHYSI